MHFPDALPTPSAPCASLHRFTAAYLQCCSAAALGCTPIPPADSVSGMFFQQHFSAHPITTTIIQLAQHIFTSISPSLTATIPTNIIWTRPTVSTVRPALLLLQTVAALPPPFRLRLRRGPRSSRMTASTSTIASCIIVCELTPGMGLCASFEVNRI